MPRTNFHFSKIISSALSHNKKHIYIDWKDGDVLRTKKLKYGSRLHKTLMRTGLVSTKDTDYIIEGNRLINYTKRELRKLNKQLVMFKVKKQRTTTIDTTKLGVEKTILQVIKLLGSENPLIQVGNTFYTINDLNRTNLINAIQDVMIGNMPDGISESDEAILYNLQMRDKFIIHRKVEKFLNKDGNVKVKPNGGFFKWTHNTELDLSKYGIYTAVDKKNYIHNCIYKALSAGGLCDEKLQDLKTQILNRNLPQSKLKYIAERYEIHIILKRDDTRHKNTIKYGNPDHQTFKIGLLDEHYFLIDKVNITRFALKHYWELSGEMKLDEFRKIVCTKKNKNGTIKSGNYRYLTSYEVIKYMLEHHKGYLSKMDMNTDIFNTQFYDKVKSWSSLEYDGNEFTFNSVLKMMVRNENINVKINKLCDRDTIYNRILSQGKNAKEGLKAAEKWLAKVSKDDYEDKVFFDFESYKHYDEELGMVVQIPYMVCWEFLDGRKGYAYGKNCARKFLDDLKVNTLLIAHNAAFDYRFLLPYVYDFKPITKGTGLISCDLEHINHTLPPTEDPSGNKIYPKLHHKIKDSLKLIPMPLRKFGKCFKLKQEKEVMNYDMYNEESLNDNLMSIKDALKHFYTKKADQKQFKKNLKKWDLDAGGYYSIVDYSRRYCEIDVSVLKQGYETFRGWLMEKPINIDIDGLNYPVLTIASLASYYLTREGCFDECYKLSGVPREFIMCAMVGGRTMARDNLKWNVTQTDPSGDEVKIADYDGVSLYPSSMVRLGGFLKGKPKVLKNKTLEFLNNQDGYFVKIRVNKVGKKLHFPLMSFVNSKGVRTFTNKLWEVVDFINPVTGLLERKKVMKNEMIVDKFQLEDLIEFQKI